MAESEREGEGENMRLAICVIGDPGNPIAPVLGRTYEVLGPFKCGGEVYFEVPACCNKPRHICPRCGMNNPAGWYAARFRLLNDPDAKLDETEREKELVRC